MNEIWKDIETVPYHQPEWPFHQVSNKGRVRVLPGGKVQGRLVTKTELRTLSVDGKGYMRICQGKLSGYDMKEAVTTLPGSLNVNPPQWTTAHKNVPPEWLSQEGHPCSIGGRYGTMQLQGDRLVCVVNPGPVTVTPREATDMRTAEAAIENPNSSGQGYDRDHVSHPLHATITKHGYSYSHSTPIHQRDGGVYHHHTYARGEHKVGVSSSDPSKWETAVSSASGHRTRGVGASTLDKHLASKNKRYKGYEGVDTAMDDVLTEGNSLRFSSPSRVQLSKAHVYFDVYTRNQSGLGNTKVSVIQGGQGNWFFDVTSHENNQFLDPGRLHGILPGGVAVTSGPPVTVGPQTASQDKARNAIQEMVEKLLAKTA
jgi:hypothetical protein